MALPVAGAQPGAAQAPAWPKNCLQLRLPFADKAMAEARRTFLASLGNDMAAVLQENVSCTPEVVAAAKAKEQRQLEEMEEEVEALQRQVLLARREVAALYSEQSVLMPVSRGSDNRRRDIMDGSGQLSAPFQQVESVSASASGRYIALVGDGQVALCESCEAGVRIVSRRAFDQVADAVFCSEDPTVQSSAMLLACGDRCLGWEPLDEAQGGEKDHAHQVFLQVVMAAGGSITTMATCQGAEGQLLLLGSSQGAVEVYNLNLHVEDSTPELLRTVSLGGAVVASSLLSFGVAFAVVAEQPKAAGDSGDPEDGAAVGEAFVYEVSSGCCEVTLSLDCRAVAGARLAYSSMLKALAVNCEDFVQVYREGLAEPERPGARISLPRGGASQASLLHDLGLSKNEQTLARSHRSAVDWCGNRPLLAVGGRNGTVLIYRFNAGKRYLEHLATLGWERDAAPPVALSWAPSLSVLIAAHRDQWRFWLLGNEEWLAETQEAYAEAPLVIAVARDGPGLFSDHAEALSREKQRLEAEQDEFEAAYPEGLAGDPAEDPENVRSLFACGDDDEEPDELRGEMSPVSPGPGRDAQPAFPQDPDSGNAASQETALQPAQAVSEQSLVGRSSPQASDSSEDIRFNRGVATMGEAAQEQPPAA